VKFALAVHPAQIAFDFHTAERALESLKRRPDGVSERAALELADTARQFGVSIVTGFIGSSIWPCHYSWFRRSGSTADSRCSPSG
jgi:hypothetical protein